MTSVLKAALILFWAVAVNFAGAQNKAWNKPYTEWSERDVNKVLSESPWAQTQIITDTSRMTFSPGQGGASHQAQSTSHWIRFLSAKPIRQALYRSCEMNRKSTPPEIEAARRFMDSEYEDTIVVAVSYDSADPQYNLQAGAKFSKATTSLLKNNTYLELNNGKRLFLQEYQPPGPDGLGAKFIFARLVDGLPFINPGHRIVRFVGMGLNVQFKIADMMFGGVLEY